ncbi:MAG: AMP-binding protein [Candidatus Woesearchaeota archaeon]
MKIFYSELNKVEVNYSDLIYDLNEFKSYKLVCNYVDFYKIFRDLIASLLNGTKIIMLDSDLSNSEIEKLNLSKSQLDAYVTCTYPEIKNLDNLMTRIQNPKNTWRIDLYTSGTTGIPKKITHNFASITRAVKISHNKSNDIWGFAYNPTHIAGIQVFFQAVLNLNSIIRLFGITKENIYKSIEIYGITNISATPTFYRLIKDDNKKFEGVKKITSGGEKFDEKLSFSLKKMFPNAKILNVYASTEIGTLFASEGENFTIKQEFKDKIKIVENELFIHKEFVNPENHKFIDGDWYKTGDYVEIIKEYPLTIKIMGRKNETINIGGYKVHLSEVEEAINAFPEVVNSIVYSKKNSVLGNILICDVVLKNNKTTEKDIHEYLSNKLQPFKVPRIINIVNEIKVTKTGKVKRI